MNSIQNLINRLNIIKQSKKLSDSFTSTSINNNNKKKVYNIINTNIKTINTYSKYLNDIANDPSGDHHQKYAILRQLRVYTDANDELGTDEKINYNLRKDILLRAYSAFPNKSSFNRTFITFILALCSGYNLYEGTQYLLDSMPSYLIENYDNYLTLAINNADSDISNPIFGVYVVYSDPDLLDAYLDVFSEDPSSFESNISIIVNDELIVKRIKNCQSSAIRTEALLFSLYLMISSMKVDGKGYDFVINELCDNLEIKIINLKINSSNKLFNLKNEDTVSNLKQFLLSLSDAQKCEILKCLGNDTITGTINSFNRNLNIPSLNKSYSNGRGYDADTHTKTRRGQQKFKRNLLSLFNGRTPKCEICGCEITGKDFLVASHILPWNRADSEQKVDPFNGLLLCPNHDFLFDSLLITFDQNGKIIISEDLSEENRRGFRVNSSTRINLSSDKEKYMKMHREAFFKKGWKL